MDGLSPSVVLSESFNHVCVLFTREDTVERPWEKACWFSLTLKASLFSVICTFPRTLPRTAKTDICLKSVLRSSTNCVSLQIVFCSCVNETTLLFFLPISTPVRENDRSLCFPNIFIKKQTWWSNDKTICYRTPLSQNIVICQRLVARRSIICLSRIIDLLATDKSRCFAQPRRINVKYWPHFSYIANVYKVLSTIGD